jgi:phage terminase large subunit-like protein
MADSDTPKHTKARAARLVMAHGLATTSETSQRSWRRWAGTSQRYCQFSTGGYAGARLPDHADAGIWGLTELMLDTPNRSRTYAFSTFLRAAGDP